MLSFLILKIIADVFNALNAAFLLVIILMLIVLR